MLQEGEDERIGFGAGGRVAREEGQWEGSVQQVGQGDKGCVRRGKDEEQESCEELS